jgi:hypothetical protein
MAERLSKHEWQTLNRGRITPDEMSIESVMAEIRAALSGITGQWIIGLANGIDRGDYEWVGDCVASALRDMSEGD